jgi:hypothetical protein
VGKQSTATSVVGEAEKGVRIRSPGKPKYNVLKAYRPIALLNTMVKVLTAVIAK